MLEPTWSGGWHVILCSSAVDATWCLGVGVWSSGRGPTGEAQAPTCPSSHLA